MFMLFGVLAIKADIIIWVIAKPVIIFAAWRREGRR